MKIEQGTEVQSSFGWGIVVWIDSLGNDEFIGVHLENGTERVFFRHELEVILDVRI